MITTDASIVGPWVCERTGGQYEAGTSTAIGWLTDGNLTAGCLFDMYNGASICMHVAADRPVTKAYTKYCFQYVFCQLKVKKAIGLVDSINDRALRFDHKLGFVEEARIANATKDGDLVILTMTKEQCRWL